MSGKNSRKWLDDATGIIWKKETIDYLKGMEDVPAEMEVQLMGMLRPHYKPKGHLLLEPFLKHTDAIYLKKGAVKLYIIDPVFEKQQILHVWIPGVIIVLYHLFRNRLDNVKYYIEVMADAQLVSISIDDMDVIYAAYPTAEKLTVDILSDKSEMRMKQLEILSIESKVNRYGQYMKLFPELVNVLGNDDLCAFLGMSGPTLCRAKERFLKGKGK